MKEEYKGNNLENQRPCVIISSARSGSKLLRDLLMQSSDFVCYPYDINYIWKTGHIGRSDDELDLTHYDEKNAEFIRRYLNRLRKSEATSTKRILEKTVSNSLRLNYVLAVLPNAQVIHLVRDGREVTASLKACWNQPSYSTKNQSRKLMLQKLMGFPFLQCWPYLVRYVKTSLLKGKDTSVKSWGPRFADIDQMLEESSLIEVCAAQWAHSIEKTNAALTRLSEGVDFIEISYESLIDDPKSNIEKMAAFLNIESTSMMERWAADNFRAQVSAWESQLIESDRDLALPILEPGLNRYGYQHLRSMAA